MFNRRKFDSGMFAQCLIVTVVCLFCGNARLQAQQFITQEQFESDHQFVHQDDKEIDVEVINKSIYSLQSMYYVVDNNLVKHGYGPAKKIKLSQDEIHLLHENVERLMSVEAIILNIESDQLDADISCNLLHSLPKLKVISIKVNPDLDLPAIKHQFCRLNTDVLYLIRSNNEF